MDQAAVVDQPVGAVAGQQQGTVQVDDLARPLVIDRSCAVTVMVPLVVLPLSFDRTDRLLAPFEIRLVPLNSALSTMLVI